MKKSTLLLGLAFAGLSTQKLNAQIVGSAAYVPGYFVNIGIAGVGGYEGADTLASPGPPGLHPRSNTQYLGFVANPQINAWASFDGDFFTPGTPENGWGIELGGTSGVKASNNRANPNEIPGSITNWQYLNGCYVVDWDGDFVGSGYDVHISIRYQLKEDDLYYTTSLKIINNDTVNSIPELYYYRNVDPDNNVFLTGDYSTTNTLVSQPSGTCGKALVSAEQTAPNHSYMGFAAIGPDYRVCYGGFSNRDASDLWNAAGFVGTPGSSVTADEAISLSYRAQSVGPRDTVDVKFVVILDATQAENAISSLFYFDYAGGLGAPKPLCSNFVDTALSCPGKTVHIELLGQNIDEFDWVWTPSTALDVDTGTVVNASPTTTTTYTITGTPTGGCFTIPVIQEIVVAMDTTSDIEFNIDVINPICANNNGSLEVVDLTGGIGPVTIEWTGGPTTNLYDNLFSGIYEVTLTDSFGCYKDSILYLENITPMTASITVDSMAICSHNSGQFTVVGANGTAPYSYDIGSGPSSTGVFSGLPAGWYMVGISDQNDCLIFEPVTIVDTSYVQTTATVDPEHCGGNNGEAVITVTNGNSPITYDIGGGPQSSNVFSSLGAGNYEVLVLDSYGCRDSVSFTIVDTNDLVATLVDTNAAICANPNGSVQVTAVNGAASGYSFTVPGHGTQTNGNFTGLTAGSYTMTVTSGTCSQDVNFVIGLDPGSLVLSPGNITDENCGLYNGVVDVHVTGGTMPYDFTINNFVSVQPDSSFTGLNDGMYIVGIEDANGCVDTVHMVVGEIPISIDLGQDMIACNEYTIMGQGAGNYLWSTGSTETSITVTQSGTYWLMVSTPDCMAMDTITITLLQNPTVTAPNIFTPNGDGQNDKFVIDNMFISTYHISIFNRWGQEMFSSDDISKSWDGKTKSGSDATEGVYMYIIEYENPCESPTMQSRHGSVQLVR